MIRRNLLIGLILLGGAVFIFRSLQTPETAPSGAALANVVVPDLSAQARDGEILFNRSCASCHGIDAAGQDGIAPPLVHKIYEPSHHGDAAFHLAAKNGVRAHHWQFGHMPPVEGITDPELDLIVLYVRELQRANGIH
ncbi:cytochrome c [Hoeflea sp. YIM 152468]|uniref:c-type cytochrome n=1 Tax=Hoeflea sp. YIM 152468 TaxID=3031759 RepID=UPI0023DBD8AE|nr:cytochrome c [Hoeflea sp. YIM 152468]MDF1610335.1 cytochrome c [Hoeflea sp. YIM 152468]